MGILVVAQQVPRKENNIALDALIDLELAICEVDGRIQPDARYSSKHISSSTCSLRERKQVHLAPDGLCVGLHFDGIVPGTTEREVVRLRLREDRAKFVLR